jgi:hypothetical protein
MVSFLRGQLQFLQARLLIPIIVSISRVMKNEMKSGREKNICVTNASVIGTDCSKEVSCIKFFVNDGRGLSPGKLPNFPNVGVRSGCHFMMKLSVK